MHLSHLASRLKTFVRMLKRAWGRPATLMAPGDVLPSSIRTFLELSQERAFGSLLWEEFKTGTENSKLSRGPGTWAVRLTACRPEFPGRVSKRRRPPHRGKEKRKLSRGRARGGSGCVCVALGSAVCCAPPAPSHLGFREAHTSPGSLSVMSTKGESSPSWFLPPTA